MARWIDQWCIPIKSEAALMCWSSLPSHCMADSSRSFSRLDAIGVPVQDRQIEAISQKLAVLRWKVLLDSLQVSREGFQHRTSLR
jgi:hypothetical protein